MDITCQDEMRACNIYTTLRTRQIRTVLTHGHSQLHHDDRGGNRDQNQGQECHAKDLQVILLESTHFYVQDEDLIERL